MGTTAMRDSGLDGIVVAETRVSEVDGQLGRLIIRGRDAEELAFNSSFEETCHLLWSDDNPKKQDLQPLFAKYRQEAFELLQKNESLLQREDPMDALRTAVSLIDSKTTVSIEEYSRLSAAVGFIAANWIRVSRGQKIQAPNPKLSQAADMLAIISGQEAKPNQVKALNIYLSTVSDHGMNASTFTARVVASTESDNTSCIVAAIGALKGPLHGGAPGPVLTMLNEIGKADKAELWIVNQLESGKRIMGMGHRIYKVRDPRAAIFEKAIKQLEDSGLSNSRLELARAVEKTAEEVLAKRHPDRPLKANVEFYTAVLLDALNIPNEIFSTIFAAGRVGGWCAHIAEQRALGRLIRPASKYTGSYPA